MDAFHQLGIAVIFGCYMLFGIGLWVKDKLTQRRDSADKRDTEKRLEGVVTFCTGVLVGFLGTADLDRHSSETRPSSTNSSSGWNLQIHPSLCPRRRQQNEV
jgi:hypothetical protein